MQHDGPQYLYVQEFADRRSIYGQNFPTYIVAGDGMFTGLMISTVTIHQ